MKLRLRFPIRVKILVAVLFLVTCVVSVITFTMANLFHVDKKAYIQQLASLVALGAGDESRSVLTGYEERLRMYARIMLADEVTEDERTRLLRDLFSEFPQLVAITLTESGEELAAVYNTGTLGAAGLTKQDVIDFRDAQPLPVEEILGGKTFVANSSLSSDLPTITLAIATQYGEQETVVLASAVVRLDEILALSARPNGFEVSLVGSDGVYLAHPDLNAVTSRQSARLRPEVEPVRKGVTSSLSLEYNQDEVEMIGAFAGVDFAGVITQAQIPRSSAYFATKELLGKLMIVALCLIAGATGLGLLWAYKITRPVERLSEATHEIGKGQFEINVDVGSSDEIGDLAISFNRMASELNVRDKALLESQSQLIQSEKLAAFGQLGAGIAHEVKNPLAGILGCAQISLRKVDGDTVVHKNLQLIEKETRRCKTIIENLLKFARQEKATYEPIQVNPVVGDAAAIVGHQLVMNKVTLETDLPEGLPPIAGNANQLQQVLMNLMMNAQQAMEGDPGEVKVTTRKIEQHLEIEISDTGPGIPAEIQDKLFDPFFTTKPGGKGTGLGLSVSFGIIQDHGGTIDLDSAPGEGATFTIRLPVAESADAEAAQPQEALLVTKT